MPGSGFIINPLDAQYDSEGTPLIMAGKALNIDLVKELLKQGVDVNKTDVYGNSAITATINTPAGGRFSEQVKLKIIRELIKAGADISIPDYKHSTPLNSAAEKGYNDIVKELIDSNPDEAAKLTKDDYGCDFYDRLSEEGKKLVDEHNPRIGKIKDFQQDVGDMCAFIAGNNQTPRSNIFNQDYGKQQTLLIKACKDHNVELVKILLKDGNNIDHQDSFGNTALIYAANQGNRAILRELIANNADIEIVNHECEDFLDHIHEDSVRIWLEETFDKVKLYIDAKKFGLLGGRVKPC